MRQVQKLLLQSISSIYSGAFSIRLQCRMLLYCNKREKNDNNKEREERRRSWRIIKNAGSHASLSFACVFVSFTNNNLIEFEWKNNTNKRQIFFCDFSILLAHNLSLISLRRLYLLQATNMPDLYLWRFELASDSDCETPNENSIFSFGTSVARRKHKGQVHQKSRSFGGFRLSASPYKITKGKILF